MIITREEARPRGSTKDSSKNNIKMVTKELESSGAEWIDLALERGAMTDSCEKSNDE